MYQCRHQEGGLADQRVSFGQRLIEMAEQDIGIASAGGAIGNAGLEARQFAIEGGGDQFVLRREAVHQAALGNPRAFGDGIEHEMAAAIFDNHRLRSVENSIAFRFPSFAPQAASAWSWAMPGRKSHSTKYSSYSNGMNFRLVTSMSFAAPSDAYPKG